MEQSYYLAGLKQGGWMTRTGQYSTDIADALVLGRTEALARCRTHKAASNILIPVLVNDMEALAR